MTRPTGMGLVATVALLAAALVFMRDYDGSEAAESAVRPMDAAPAHLESELSDPTPESESVHEAERVLAADLGPAAEPVAAVAPVARLEVRVVHAADGAAVAGVTVGALVLLADRTKTFSNDADANGRVSIEVPAPGQLIVITVEASSTTVGGSFREGTWLAAGTSSDFTLRVSSGGTLHGRVVDAEAAPIGGATVRGWCGGNSYDPERTPDRVVTAGEDGTFTILHLGTDFALDAVADGMACTQGLRGELAPGEVAEGELVLVMHSAVTFTGRVVDSRDEPVEGVSIAVEEQGTRRSTDSTGVGKVVQFTPVRVRAESAANGSFVLGPMPRRAEPKTAATTIGGTLSDSGQVPATLSNNGWRVRATHSDFLRWTGQTPTPGAELVIRLDSGDSIPGIVLGPDDAPVAGAVVRFGPFAGGRATTADNGRFVLSALERGKRGYVSVEADGLAPLVKGGVEVIAPPTPDLVLRLETGLDIAGTVLDEDGTPLAGAEVRVEGERTFDRGYSSFGQPDTWEWLMGRGQTYTAPNGAFRLADLYPGAFQLSVHPADAPETSHDVIVEAGTEDLVIRFDRAASEKVVLEGRVVDSHTGDPVTSFTLTPMVLDDDGSAMGTNVPIEATDGVFRITGFNPGRIGLNVIAPGYAEWKGGTRDYDIGEHDHQVQLSELRSVELRLLTSAGEPTPGRWRATFATAAGGDIWPELAGGGGSTSSLKLSDGKVRANGLPAESIQITFHESERDGLRTFDVDLGVDRRDLIDFIVDLEVLSPAANVQFIVCGAPADVELPEAIVQPTDKSWIDMLQASDDAWFIDTSVEVVASKAPGHTLASATLTLVDGTYSFESLRPGSGDSTSASAIELPLVFLEVPGLADTLRLSAKGYAEQSFELEPETENLGLPHIVFLRR